MTALVAPTGGLEANAVDQTDAAAMNCFLDGIAAAFSNTQLSRAFITEIDNTPPPYPSPSFNAPRIRRHIEDAIRNSAASGSELVEAGGYSALAIWETPGYRGIPFTDTHRNAGPIRQQWRESVQSLKEKHIGLRTKENGTQELNPFYHLDFLARNPNVEAVPGAISAVLKPWLKRAEDEGLPAWLEATYDHAVQVYEHFGFRLVEVVRVGVGSRSEEGWPEEGGKGVRGYAMIYDRHLREQATDT